MRDIEFRGKRVDNGEWAEGYYFCLTHPDRRHEHHFIIPFGVDLTKGRPLSEIQIEVNPETVGQYTGLNDKNENKIFEGDIVTRIAPIYELGKNEPVGKYQAIGVVTVVEDSNEPPSIVIKSHDHLGNEADRLLFVKPSGWHDPWYVIGNIHDNPELLKEADNA